MRLSFQNVPTTRAEGQGIEYALKFLGLWEESDEAETADTGTEACDTGIGS